MDQHDVVMIPFLSIHLTSNARVSRCVAVRVEFQLEGKTFAEAVAVGIATVKTGIIPHHR
jgi:hypothetical protein